MSEAKRERYVSVVMNEEEFAVLDDFCWRHRIRSRSEAIRRLIRVGMEHWSDEEDEERPG